MDEDIIGADKVDIEKGIWAIKTRRNSGRRVEFVQAKRSE